MNAKTYLEQLQEFDVIINQNLERLSEMMEDAASVGAVDYSVDRVQTSNNGGKLCNDVVRYLSFNEEINAEIDRYIDAKNQIISEIRGLHNPNLIQVLYKIYVQFKSIKVASDEMGLSYSYTVALHKKALRAFEEKYPDLKYISI